MALGRLREYEPFENRAGLFGTGDRAGGDHGGPWRLAVRGVSMSEALNPDGAAGGWLGRVIPAADWLRRYEGAWLRADLAAGITLAAYLLPAGLGDASLAGLPPQAGLYACLFSGLVFWLFCSSRHTAITVTSAISLLMGTSLGELAHGDMARYPAPAPASAVRVAAVACPAWGGRAGVIVNFISQTVLI